MKNPSVALYKAFYNAIGDTVTVDGTDYPYYGADIPSPPADVYLWCSVTTSDDTGTRDRFNYEYLVQLTCVAKSTLPAGATFTCETVLDAAVSFVQRGTGLTGPDGNFTIDSIKLFDTDSGESNYGNIREKYSRIIFTVGIGEN